MQILKFFNVNSILVAQTGLIYG